MKLNLFLGLLVVLYVCLIAVFQTCQAHDKTDTLQFTTPWSVSQLESLMVVHDNFILARLRLDSLEKALKAKVKK